MDESTDVRRSGPSEPSWKRISEVDFGEQAAAFAVVKRAGAALGFAHDAEGTAEAVGDEIILRFVVMVESALGEVEACRDAVDRGAAIAVGVDLPRGGFQEILLRRIDAGGDAEQADVGWRRCDGLRRDAVDHDV